LVTARRRVRFCGAAVADPTCRVFLLDAGEEGQSCRSGIGSPSCGALLGHETASFLCSVWVEGLLLILHMKTTDTKGLFHAFT